MKIKKGIFIRRSGEVVVDSMCKCGHLESEHGSKSTRLPDGALLREEGHGNCCKGKCACARFTWERFVTLDERADKIIADRKNGQLAVA